MCLDEADGEGEPDRSGYDRGDGELPRAWTCEPEQGEAENGTDLRAARAGDDQQAVEEDERGGGGEERRAGSRAERGEERDRQREREEHRVGRRLLPEAPVARVEA